MTAMIHDRQTHKHRHCPNGGLKDVSTQVKLLSPFDRGSRFGQRGVQTSTAARRAADRLQPNRAVLFRPVCIIAMSWLLASICCSGTDTEPVLRSNLKARLDDADPRSVTAKNPVQCLQLMGRRCSQGLELPAFAFENRVVLHLVDDEWLGEGVPLGHPHTKRRRASIYSVEYRALKDKGSSRDSVINTRR